MQDLRVGLCCSALQIEKHCRRYKGKRDFSTEDKNEERQIEARTVHALQKPQLHCGMSQRGFVKG